MFVQLSSVCLTFFPAHSLPFIKFPEATNLYRLCYNKYIVTLKMVTEMFAETLNDC
jgi:hypothetical protein